MADSLPLTAEKKVTSKLLQPPKTSEKVYKIDDHMVAAVAGACLQAILDACVNSCLNNLFLSSHNIVGMTADAGILVNYARLTSQRYRFAYQDPQPVEQLVMGVCNYKQAYTQYGGQRPFGVSFLYAGWDEHYGFQLYNSDPSGNYGGWKAHAVGANNQAAQGILKTDYSEGISIEAGLKLCVKVLNKSMDSTTANADKMEFFVLSRPDGKLKHHYYNVEETAKLLKEVEAETAASGDM
jgi:20S proteasome subunit alpha 3